MVPHCLPKLKPPLSPLHSWLFRFLQHPTPLLHAPCDAAIHTGAFFVDAFRLPQLSLGHRPRSFSAVVAAGTYRAGNGGGVTAGLTQRGFPWTPPRTPATPKALVPPFGRGASPRFLLHGNKNPYRRTATAAHAPWQVPGLDPRPRAGAGTGGPLVPLRSLS